MYNGVIARYKEYLPISEKTPVVTLLEGNTPLISAKNLARALEVDFQIFLKYEGANPTGSFKDRGMTMAVSRAKEENTAAVICASTGNTSASAAAYAARAKLRCIVLIPEGAIALGKLSQALMHGAEVLAIKGNFDDALKLVREITRKYPITLVNSINPMRIEGQKTASFEIVDALGTAPDYQFMPVGNAGNITAYWKGYKEYAEGRGQRAEGREQMPEGRYQMSDIRYQKPNPKLPKMMGFQAEGSAPIVRGYPIKNPETIATAIRIGNPASWKKAEQARDESGGVIDLVSDEEIMQAYKLLAEEEGLFVEPASAASVAGLKKYIQQGFFNRHLTSDIRHLKVVCILTGHGLKDPDRAIKLAHPPRIVKASFSSVIRELQL